MSKTNMKQVIKNEKISIYETYDKKIIALQKEIEELECDSHLRSIVAELKATYKKGLLDDLEKMRSNGFAYLEDNKWRPCFNFSEEYDEFMLNYLEKKQSIDYLEREYDEIAWSKAWRRVEELQKPLKKEIQALERESQQKAFDKETEYIDKFYVDYPNLHPDKLDSINKYNLKIEPLTWSVNCFYDDLEEREEEELRKIAKDFLVDHQKQVDRNRFVSLDGKAWNDTTIYKGLSREQWATLLKTDHITIEKFICTRGGANQYKIDLNGVQVYFTDIQNYPTYENEYKPLLKSIDEGIGRILKRNDKLNEIHAQYNTLGKVLREERKRILKERKERLKNALDLFK